MRASWIVSGLAICGAGAFWAEGDARACGGCFQTPPPPNETDSVVTDHRMILSISPQQSTLYDQIHYTGSPSSFAWVLPISGTATVGLSADVVFAALDSLTQTDVQAPPTNCPAAPTNCNSGTNASFSAPGIADPSGGASDGVTVTVQQVVGPYETVQLAATDPQALENWLRANGFNIPSDVQPVVAAYVSEHFDFLAMKLVPGASVQSMRPVRVSTDGASPALPLRMVAAGTGATVGITLWVLASGRYEPQNFGSFIITSDELVWDWATSSSNYAALRTAKSDGKTWEIESSMQLAQAAIQARILNSPYGAPVGSGVGIVSSGDAGADYLPITDDGGVIEGADQVRQDDLTTLFNGLDTTLRVTRMRADLSRAALATDLDLQAAADQSPIQAQRIASQESGQPQCAIYNGCTYVGQGPRDQAIAEAAGNGKETFGCATTTSWMSPKAPLVLLGLAGLVGGAFARSRKRRP